MKRSQCQFSHDTKRFIQVHNRDEIPADCPTRGVGQTCYMLCLQMSICPAEPNKKENDKHNTNDTPYQIQQCVNSNKHSIYSCKLIYSFLWIIFSESNPHRNRN